MKKLTVLSMIAAALLLTACGDSATGEEAKKASMETKTEAPMKCAAGKCGGEGKCGGDKKSATDEAKDAVSNAAEKVKAAATEKVEEAKAAVSSAVDSAKAATTEKVEEAKAATSSAVDSAKAAAGSAVAAVASAVDTGAGKALYAKCVGCHGADGKTKAMGKSAMVAGQSAADLETKLQGYKAGTRNVAGMGMIMKGQVGSMSDDDIKAIAAYMAGL